MIRQKIWDYSIQICIVIFGVFLGMLLSEWNSDRKQYNHQQAILKQILSEIKGHQSRLISVIPYHDTLTQTVDSLVRVSDNDFLLRPFLLNGAWSQIPHWSGIELFPLHMSAYESAKISNTLSSLDSDKLETIISYYETIRLYNNMSAMVAQQVFETSSDTKLMDILLQVVFLREDMLGQERQILTNAKKMEELLDSDNY